MTDPAAPDRGRIGCHEARLSLGVLVLGAIEPEDRSLVEAHLAQCAACSTELAELAVLPGLLKRLDAPAVESVEVPNRRRDQPNGATGSGDQNSGAVRSARCR